MFVFGLLQIFSYFQQSNLFLRRFIQVAETEEFAWNKKNQDDDMKNAASKCFRLVLCWVRLSVFMGKSLRHDETQLAKRLLSGCVPFASRI